MLFNEITLKYYHIDKLVSDGSFHLIFKRLSVYLGVKHVKDSTGAMTACHR